MEYFLSGDIGGTKTLLQLCATTDARTPVLQKSYVSASYVALTEIIDEFLSAAGPHEIKAGCFALAGPVDGRIAKLTNLPWVVNADELGNRFAIRNVKLINDFEAAGYGVAELQPEELQRLQDGEEQVSGTRLVVGAGTGLGVAWLPWQDGHYRVHPSEAGHMDFAPTDEMQNSLLRYLHNRYEHVSYERLVSGQGLIAIYEFLRDTGRAVPSAHFSAAMETEDAAAVITQFAGSGGEEIARKTVALFLAVYGAFVGNMALAVLPRGGVYIAGGIAAKIAAQMQAGTFMKSFINKGRYAGILSKLPVHVVLNTKVGLIGAGMMARQLI